MIKLNLIVIRTSMLEELVSQYELLGMKFIQHSHGNGPKHFCHEDDDFVFEIYPLDSSKHSLDSSLRLGFDIPTLQSIIAKLKNGGWKIIKEIHATEWGNIAVVQDIDGRKIELKEV